MKLVDILARVLKAWPDACSSICQSFNDTKIFFGCGVQPIDMSIQASDHYDSVVTRAEWQAAVDALNAPKVVEWDGEGYPPIGLFCEYRGTESGIWSGCEIVAVRNNAWIVLGDGYETDFVTLESLRPRRTAEQVAAEEIEAIREFLIYEHCDGGLIGIAKALHESGYRKEPKPCGS